MMNNNNKKNGIEVRFGEGKTTLFLELRRSGLRVLDYELDCDYIHKKCGGRRYYTSRSGLSGAGWIKSLRDLIQVGCYRCDTKYPIYDSHPFYVYGCKVEIFLPYNLHGGFYYPDNQGGVYKYTTRCEEVYGEVIIRITSKERVYFITCFFEKLEAILKKLAAKGLEAFAFMEVKNTFINAEGEEIEVSYFVLQDEERDMNKEYLNSFWDMLDVPAVWPEMALCKIFRFAERNGKFARTKKFLGSYYPVELIDGDPINPKNCSSKYTVDIGNKVLWCENDEGLFVLFWTKWRERIQKVLIRRKRKGEINEALFHYLMEQAKSLATYEEMSLRNLSKFRLIYSKSKIINEIQKGFNESIKFWMEWKECEYEDSIKDEDL